MPATTVKMPKVPSLPVPSGVRSPRGWGQEFSIRRRDLRFAAKLKPNQPAGDPPGWWQARYPAGTRPEWAVFWAFTKLGMTPGKDFIYQAQLPGITVSYTSTTDFLLPDTRIAIEVQGLFWHYGQGSPKMFHDRMRAAALAGLNYQLVFIDEDAALENPLWVTKEAIAGRDHSRLAGQG